MDSLHDDLCGSALDDITSDLVYSRNQDVPEKHCHVLCDKCKANPKKLCRRCAKLIARLLSGGHVDITSDSGENSKETSESSTASSEGYLVIGERFNVAPSSSRAWEAGVSAGSPTQNRPPTQIRTSVSQSEAEIREAYARQFTTTTTTTTTTTATTTCSRPTCSTFQSCPTCILERERHLKRESHARAEAIRLEAEAALARAREVARFKDWLCERRAHRKWQRDMLQILSFDPARKRQFQRNSIKTCFCHGDPDCRVLIDQEYRRHVALLEADRDYWAYDGRGIVNWVPFLAGKEGNKAAKYWVEKDMTYLRRSSRVQIQDLLGLWRMEVILGHVWGRLPDARWRVQRTEPQEEKWPVLGWIQMFCGDAESEMEKTAVLLQQRNLERGWRPKLVRENFKGCLLFERNPCWSLLPLLRDGGDVCLVWRWERCVFENSSTWTLGNPFNWLWGVCLTAIADLSFIWKRLARWVRGLGFVDEEEDDGVID